MGHESNRLDELDLAILTAMREHPRVGVLELSRLTKVARATVQSRIKHMEDSGVIQGYGPDIDIAAAGFDVQAIVTLEIAQGDLGTVTADLSAIPGVLEAYATTGSGDVVCRICADSHSGLQAVLLDVDRSAAVVRSTSVIVLSTVVPRRDMPLLRTLPPTTSSRAPAYRTVREF